MKHQNPDRRTLVTGLGAATAAALAVGATRLQAQAPASGFQPARHDLDRWMDELPGQHRVFIDSGTAGGGAEAVLYANNLYNANQGAYGLGPGEQAIIVCFRHFSTPFGYNDAMWAKYGEAFHGMMQFPDPDTGQAPTINLMNSDAYGLRLPNFGTTIDSLRGRGTQFAVCNAATTFIAGQLAEANGTDATDVYNELVGNSIPDARFVSAGVVALTRAQEYGYSLLSAG